MAKIVDLEPDCPFEVGRRVRLCVDSKDSGEIQLDYVSISGPKRAPSSTAETNGADLGKTKSVTAQLVEHNLSKLDEFREEISFVPHSPGKYTIDIRCLGQPVGSSPIEIEVRAAGARQVVAEEFSSRQLATNTGGNPSKAARQTSMAPGFNREEELLRSIVVHGVSLKCSPVNSTGAFIIETNRLAQARDFDVLITDPGNNLVDVQCYLQQDGNLLAEWTPKRIGKSEVSSSIISCGARLYSCRWHDRVVP